MCDEAFEVLSSIGAGAYCSPIAMDEIVRTHPDRIRACKELSASIIPDLMRALLNEMIDIYTLRDYLKMLEALHEYRAMYLYIVLCFFSAELPVPLTYLIYGQNPDMLALLMREMLSDIDVYIREINALKEKGDE